MCTWRRGLHGPDGRNPGGTPGRQVPVGRKYDGARQQTRLTRKLIHDSRANECSGVEWSGEWTVRLGLPAAACCTAALYTTLSTGHVERNAWAQTPLLRLVADLFDSKSYNNLHNIWTYGFVIDFGFATDLLYSVLCNESAKIEVTGVWALVLVSLSIISHSVSSVTPVSLIRRTIK